MGLTRDSLLACVGFRRRFTGVLRTVRGPAEPRPRATLLALRARDRRLIGSLSLHHSAISSPFVVAAVKGVVRAWCPALWGVIAIAVLVAAVTTSNDDGAGSATLGLLLVLLIVGSATRTGLLDNERVRLGK